MEINTNRETGTITINGREFTIYKLTKEVNVVAYEPDYNADIIDTRDLVDRFNELEEELEEFEEIIALYNSRASEFDTLAEFKDWYSDEYELYEELEKIRELTEDLSDADDDFEDGIILIAEENFTAYCKDLVEDIGDAPVLPTYMVVDIDWDATADNLRVDYSEVEFHGNTYLYR
jgi:hypothetical protein